MMMAILHNPILFLISLSFLFPFDSAIVSADDLTFKSKCWGVSFNKNTTFHANLNTLLNSLRSKSLLYNTDTTSTGNGLDCVHGLFSCKDNLPHKDCHTCIEFIILGTLANCSSSRRATIWNDHCKLCYSDYSFSGVHGIKKTKSTVKFFSEGLMELIKDPVVARLHRRSLVAPEPTTSSGGGGKNKSSPAAMPIMASILVVVVICTILYCIYCWRWRRRNAIRKAQVNAFKTIPSSDLPLMDLLAIQAATDNFSEANKLGEGGFGPVYRGVLCGGTEIAIKRLSTRSKQGAIEFKNEVDLIAKLQHRNLVRVLGYCIENDEKLLIYEFLPNKSLDAFLFDPNKQHQLDWNTRHQIIIGIARGLLYLHEDSLLKIIHRDLKASNVLLDSNMNPKISDFGMAKIFEDESEVNFGHVVGTYGYMAPEYAMEGIFSVKSDVFSFGVLMLEILSGCRNSVAHLKKYGETLLGHAWQLWKEERVMDYMDPSLRDSYPIAEARRCFHIGLLCIQENPEYRPTMSSVVVTLRSEQMPLSPPTEPPSYAGVRERDISPFHPGISPSKTDSINEVTITCINPR